MDILSDLYFFLSLISLSFCESAIMTFLGCISIYFIFGENGKNMISSNWNYILKICGFCFLIGFFVLLIRDFIFKSPFVI
ncbi:MAG: hypothetical protein COV57_03020 [Candidatus Liptonbacteria bacterium CG11_big_fil_rev_8_21_14_0_20_35_14]|uniref:Uncharacterized protein n=1 Tax=Candidatus Liptonbacteria bacterium CG11_big_fil_rev_8_21_14_0_20_35_14 TaxID=1974634 RepID=A0A2H0N731_9BACT|nr:MAG: hypothetical protein COV57_03020 [Candidatus Liptonbacteria bacterium CG11_big_fil_rev_8_21_14_0_20_35_14]